jgi:hypothetical protein
MGAICSPKWHGGARSLVWGAESNQPEGRTRNTVINSWLPMLDSTNPECNEAAMTAIPTGHGRPIPFAAI